MKTAWFGEPKLKARAMARLREHRRLDHFVQRYGYWENGRGCHLGCLTHVGSFDDVHAAMKRMFGIPQIVARWAEIIFERLPKEQCGDWVIDSTDSWGVNADMSLAHHELGYWLLGPDSPSAAGNSHPSVADEISRVRDLHDRARNGQAVSDAEWSAAYSAEYSAACWAAESAACSAAYSARSAAYLAACLAARSAAESAARSAAESARSAAWSAAYSARSAAYSAGRSAAWQKIAAKSIEIFRACPIVACDDCGRDAAASLLALGDDLDVAVERNIAALQR